MPFHLGRLGWRNPRPNDFSSPDERPLKDMFGNIQQYMTWPHFELDIDNQAVTGTYAKLSVTPVDDPYQLIRTTDVIQVPRDFDKWMFIGHASGQYTPRTLGRYLLGWLHNGVADNDLISEQNAAAAISTVTRHRAPVMWPVRKGDTLELAAATDPDDTFFIGSARGYFLPMA